MRKALLVAMCALMMTGCGLNSKDEPPPVLSAAPPPLPPPPAQFTVICGEQLPKLEFNTDASGRMTMTRAQAVRNQQAADATIAECQRRQQGLLAAWPKHDPG